MAKFIKVVDGKRDCGEYRWINTKFIESIVVRNGNTLIHLSNYSIETSTSIEDVVSQLGD